MKLRIFCLGLLHICGVQSSEPKIKWCPPDAAVISAAGDWCENTGRGCMIGAGLVAVSNAACESICGIASPYVNQIVWASGGSGLICFACKMASDVQMQKIAAQKVAEQQKME